MSRQPVTIAQYRKLVSDATPSSRMLMGYVRAFWVGGLICVLGQALSGLYRRAGLDEESAGTAVSVTLVFLGALLTGLGVYDDIARYAGAGTLVPITGFANAVAAPALEFKREGFVAGTCARMFAIAGPVIVFGVGSSVIYGVILVLLDLI